MIVDQLPDRRQMDEDLIPIASEVKKFLEKRYITENKTIESYPDSFAPLINLQIPKNTAPSEEHKIYWHINAVGCHYSSRRYSHYHQIVFSPFTGGL
ncbi:hypothetical protein CEXT_191241 [Caerostris extrusa]|uniref:Uncharacterized protein n=1 Tax=Caerostris extrusa TaxID=172846 RepID=A0AAV4N631_CAEEX|nr:hypothetical protein CEXT_191241 [Caerostris extrusa]